MIFLVNWGALVRFDIMAWVVGLLVVAAAVALLYVQQRQSRQLRAELDQLQKIKRHTIEYELVLKVMKLCIWRLDVPTWTVTYDSDYRDATDMVVFPSGINFNKVGALLVPAYADKVKREMRELAEGRIEEFHEQYEMKAPHGDHTYWVETYATVDKRDMAGKPLTIVGTSLRIDKQKEIEQALIDARNQAEESDRLKSAFLANISHEIRTPLNAIVGFSDVLPMVSSEEEREQLIGLIKQNNAHLLRLIDNIVHISKLEVGGEAVKKTRFEIKPLLEEAVTRHASRVDAARIQMKTQVADEVQELYTDRDRLLEILNQYVDNAVKFTTDGEITLGCDLQGQLLRVWVRDTGKGIPADCCDDRLFERFVKVDEFVPGTGLGLSICRSIAQSLGGKVGVQSTLGEGSLFWAELPVG
ncbi:MAG: HAMP domain-containing histidine kinase [Prevotella sp.]|nr:HAMP domain-containing histidine kinase [Prevotella sp.]